MELSPAVALLTYLGLTTGAVLLLWALRHYSTRRQTIFTPEKELFICEFCHHAYLSEGVRAVTQCPQCKSYNKPEAISFKK